MTPRRRAHATPPDPKTIIAATQSQWIARFGMNELTTTANASITPTTTMAQAAEAGHDFGAIARAPPVFRLLLKLSPRVQVGRENVFLTHHTLEMRSANATIPEIPAAVWNGQTRPMC